MILRLTQTAWGTIYGFTASAMLARVRPTSISIYSDKTLSKFENLSCSFSFHRLKTKLFFNGLLFKKTLA